MEVSTSLHSRIAKVLPLILVCFLSGAFSWSTSSRASSLVGETEEIKTIDDLYFLGDDGISTAEKAGALPQDETCSSMLEKGQPGEFVSKQYPAMVDGNNLVKGRQRKCERCSDYLSFQRREESSCEDDSSSSSMILLLNGELYTPTPIGRAHILLAGKSIVAIFREEEFPWDNLVGLPVKIIDVNGSLVVPGFIDIHVHITGGGGEAGPASRTPEASLSELLNAGLTTVVGTLGTDCVSRSLENLRTKAAALKQEGLSAYMWSGCYRVPSPTLTGSLVRDLQLIEEVIGAGEIAISDHRGSWPNTDELLKMVSDARVGGMLSGKAGIVHFHTGAALSLLDPLWDVINASKGAIPITQMIPTHISSRGQALLEAAETWIQAGGRVDFTSDQEGESDSFTALRDWARKGNVALEHVSLSSDGFGSLQYYDKQGRLLKEVGGGDGWRCAGIEFSKSPNRICHCNRTADENSYMDKDGIIRTVMGLLCFPYVVMLMITWAAMAPKGLAL